MSEIMRIRKMYRKGLSAPEAYQIAAERRARAAKVLAHMRGWDGRPAAEYERWLVRSKSGRLFVISVSQDWIDTWDNEREEIVYEEDWDVIVEKITPQEAQDLLWDEIYDEIPSR